MKTIYKYLTGGREVTFEDEEGVYKPEDIKAHWAATFPELGAATWDTTEKDGVKIVTFAKKVGTKGADSPVLAALLACPQRPVPGAALLAHLYELDEPDIDRLAELQPEIERALDASRGLAHRSTKAIERCLKLKPVPQPKAPTGF